MSHSTGGPPSLATSCATIGAGRRIARLSEPLSTDVAAAAGDRGGGKGGSLLAVRNWPSIRGRAADLPGHPVLGSLAGTLEAAGIRVTYLPERAGSVGGGAWVAVNPGGSIERASEQPFPSGWGAILAAAPPGSLLVADIAATPGGEAEIARAVRSDLLPSLDAARDRVMLAAPLPAGDPQANLAPVVIWSDAPPGALTSPTTRTPGLIASIDLAPAILEWFGLAAPPEMEGRSVSTGSPLNPAALVNYAGQAHANREGFIPILVAMGLAMALSGAGVVLSLVRRAPRAAISRSRAALGMAACLPAAFLVAAWLRPATVAQLAGAICLAAVALAAAALMLGRRGSALLAAYGLTALLVLADMVAGGRGMALALLSDFPVTGMRFYGIGNEYGGVLLGMGLALPLWMADASGAREMTRRTWVVCAAWWALLILLIAAPAIGAKFGGGVTAFAGALSCGRLLVRRPWRWIELLPYALLTLAVAALIVVLHTLYPAEGASHLGLFGRDIAARGGAAVVEVVLRKAGMAWRLLTSIPTIVAVGTITPLLLLWRRRLGAPSTAVLRERPLLRAGVYGTLGASFAALLINDSGVVAWGFMAGSALAFWLDAVAAEPPSPQQPARE